MKYTKDIITGMDARRALLSGMEKVAESVATTLGPKGQNVAIAQPSGAPQIVHDGVTVAKSIDLPDDFEDVGAQMVKLAAQKTNDKAGDGTTTASILTYEIARKGFELVGVGVNPMVVKAEIDMALSSVLKELKKLSRPVKNSAEIRQIATISSTNAEIGKLVAEAIERVGKDGVVTVETGKGMETTVDYKQGMEIGRGFLSPQFVTDESRAEAVIEDPYILITDKKINYNYEILPFLDKVIKETKSTNLVIIASEVIEEALATLVVNKLRGALHCVAIQAPSFGGLRIDELNDIAILTGGTVIQADTGRGLDTVEISELGRAGKVTANREKTIILDGKGSPEAIKRRSEELQQQIDIADSDYEKDVKRERLAKLSGGVAVINVGAATEVELNDKRERVIDAVNATKAAIEEGIVAGGEMALITISNRMRDSFLTEGGKLLTEAMRMPFRKLTENAGMDYAESWRRIADNAYPMGIDVQDGALKDLIKGGIIDPVKVARLALENAVSVATMAITTRVIIVDHKEEEKK